MGYFDYKQGQEIAVLGYSFNAVIQAAMRQADTDNLEKLKAGFPAVYRDLFDRYNAPGGLLEGEHLAKVFDLEEGGE